MRYSSFKAVTTAGNQFWKHLICSIPIDINENINQVLTNLFHLDPFFDHVTVASKSKVCQKLIFQCWLWIRTAFCWTLSFTYIHLLINYVSRKIHMFKISYEHFYKICDMWCLICPPFLSHQCSTICGKIMLFWGI